MEHPTDRTDLDTTRAPRFGAPRPPSRLARIGEALRRLLSPSQPARAPRNGPQPNFAAGNRDLAEARQAEKTVSFVTDREDLTIHPCLGPLSEPGALQMTDLKVESMRLSPDATSLIVKFSGARPDLGDEASGAKTLRTYVNVRLKEDETLSSILQRARAMVSESTIMLVRRPRAPE